MISEKINSNKYKNSINLAGKYQDQITFYSQRDSTPYSNEFKQRVLKVYNGNKNKLDRFEKAFKSDVLPSLEIIDTIYNNLYKIFDSRDMVVKRNVNTNDDYISYLDSFYRFWTQDVWKAFQTKYNSIIIVDTPKEQVELYPYAYPFLLDIRRVKYIEKDLQGDISEIIFTSKEKDREIYYYYTKDFYSAYIIESGVDVLIFNNQHNLGYCPAKFMLSNKLLDNDWVLRKNATINHVEDLFWYVFKTIESNKADLLYLNPDKQQPLSSCGHEKGNQKCFGGKLVDKNKKPVIENGTHVLCPNCGEDKHGGGGAGNVYSIDFSASAVKDGSVNPSSPLVHYISPNIEGVKEQYSRLKEKKEDIIKSVIGESKLTTKEAINEKQVNATYDSKENILRFLSDEFSNTIEWAEKTQLKLRYSNDYKSNSYFLGSLFYTMSISELQDQKTTTTNPIQKREIEEQIIELKYKKNPEKLNREKLLIKLLPYSDLSDSEFLELFKSQQINKNEFDLRFKFNSLIDLFELDNGSIYSFYNNNFQKNVNQSQRLKVIRDLLNIILTEKIKENV